MGDRSCVSDTPALLFGYNRLGGIAQLLSLLRRRGYRRFAVIVNAPDQLSDLVPADDIEFIKYDDPFSGAEMLRCIRAVEGFGPHSPMVCLQDRPMLAFLDAFEVVTDDLDGSPWIPVAGIRNARVKPRARELWDRAGLDGPRWTIVTGDAARDSVSARRAGLSTSDAVDYIVKPIHGMASEFVTTARGWSAALDSADRIREAYRGARASRAPRAERLSFEDCSYDPERDVLIEEELQGPEYTVDGFVQFGVVHAVVQHKETRRRHPFFGDGLIVSPPDPRCCVAPSLGLPPEPHCGLEESVFVDVVRRGLNALGIDSWSFHAEMIVHNGVPNFVELNPRPAGGLLWQTAGLRLGVDPIEATVALHLRERLEPSRRGGVMGQFPIYADLCGRFSEVIGRDEALGVPGVYEVRSAMPADGILVSSLECENYLAFVSLCCDTHQEVRAACDRVQKLVRAV